MGFRFCFRFLLIWGFRFCFWFGVSGFVYGFLLSFFSRFVGLGSGVLSSVLDLDVGFCVEGSYFG